MIKEGSDVKWKWGSGYAKGKVKDTFDHEVTKTIDEAEVTRKDEEGNKALLIQQKDDSEALKLEPLYFLHKG